MFTCFLDLLEILDMLLSYTCLHIGMSPGSASVPNSMSASLKLFSGNKVRAGLRSGNKVMQGHRFGTQIPQELHFGNKDPQARRCVLTRAHALLHVGTHGHARLCVLMRHSCIVSLPIRAGVFLSCRVSRQKIHGTRLRYGLLGLPNRHI